MATITISIDGASHSVDATPSQVAALGAARVTYNTRVPDAMAVAGDVEFLTAQVVDRLAQYPDEAPAEIMARALANWAGDPIPAEVVQSLTPEARKAQLIAYAADKRWRVASSGVVVNGVAVPSDDVADGRIRRALSDLREGIQVEPLTFILGAVVVPATEEMFLALRTAISRKWQLSYAVQGDVVTGVLADTITTEQQIDAANWPA